MPIVELQERDVPRISRPQALQLKPTVEPHATHERKYTKTSNKATQQKIRRNKGKKRKTKERRGPKTRRRNYEWGKGKERGRNRKAEVRKL
jgi:hypothetical protein